MKLITFFCFIFSFLPNCLPSQPATELHKKEIYNSSGLVTAEETYQLLENGERSLYRTEKFFWQKHTTEDHWLLKGQATEDEAGLVHKCTLYHYNDKGLITQETLYGNLTGEGLSTFQVDEKGIPIESGVESYSKFYRYTDSFPYKIVEEKEESGRSDHYRYDEQGNPTAKFLCFNGEPKIRLFFDYTEEGSLYHVICDNGSSFEREDLSDLTEEQAITLRKEEDYEETTYSIEETARNPQTAVHEIIRTKRLTFSEQSTPTSEEIYSAYGEYLYGKFSTLDQHGRTVSSQDTLGNHFHQLFNEEGQPLSKNGEEEYQSEYEYDKKGRLYSLKKYFPDSRVVTENYHYDEKDRLSHIEDALGNRTEFHFDFLERIIEQTFPPLADQEESMTPPSKKMEYNILDQITSTTDQNGYHYLQTLNARGSPIHIQFPDGTEERYTYFLDGKLKEKTSRNGTKISFKYDFLSREVEKKVTGTDGSSVLEYRKNYGPFHLLSTTNALGETTYYSYNLMGNLIEEKSEWNGEVKRTTFEYDSSDNLYRTNRWYGERADQYQSLISARDFQGKIVAERIEDTIGKVLKELFYKEEKKNPEEKSYFEEDDQLKKIESSEQQILITTYNSLGKIQSIEQFDKNHSPISTTEYKYSGTGKTTAVNHSIFSSTGEKQTIHSTEWFYGAMDRLERLIEGVSPASQTVTTLHYNGRGEVEAVTKPDGTEIYYSYDSFGRVEELYSSDQTIHYIYTYDALNRPTAITNKLTGCTTSRTYNSLGKIVEEELENGLSTYSRYDQIGRKLSLSLHDNSSILYHYNSTYLTSVERISSNGTSLYSYTYNSFDLDGNPIQTEMIDQLGTINYKWHRAGFLESITTPFWSEVIPSDAYDKNGNIQQIKVIDPKGEIDLHYSYDSKGQLIHEFEEEAKTYSYDTMGNRTSNDQTDYINNLFNQLIDKKEGAATSLLSFKYDLNGNLTSKHSPFGEIHFQYDALNRLISVTREKLFRVTYSYDPFHRRMDKTLYHWNKRDERWERSEKILFLYDGDKEIGATDEQGKIKQFRALGIGLGAEIGAAIAVEIGDKIYAPIHDHRGSLCCLIDTETKEPAECYRYSAFGKEKIYDSAGKPLSHSKIGNGWRFSSKRNDPETGFIFFGRRHYDPLNGRWSSCDPLGFGDGPNKYLFVENNPVNKIDLYGLFSFSTFFESCYNCGMQFYGNLSTLSQNACNFFFRKLEHAKQVEEHVENLAKDLLGEILFHMTGYYLHEDKDGVYGEGEISNNVRISYVNGIMTPFDGCLENANLISSTHGNNNVHYIYHSTNGWSSDMKMAILAKFGAVLDQSYRIASRWKKLIDEMDGPEEEKRILHYAHSIGGTYTYRAKMLLEPYEQKMIRVVTIGSATLIPDNGDFESVTNYVSVLDGVPLLVDPVSIFQRLFYGSCHIIFLDPSEQCYLPIDHLFCTESYRKIIEQLGEQFLESYKPE